MPCRPGCVQLCRTLQASLRSPCVQLTDPQFWAARSWGGHSGARFSRPTPSVARSHGLDIAIALSSLHSRQWNFMKQSKAVSARASRQQTAERAQFGSRKVSVPAQESRPSSYWDGTRKWKLFGSVLWILPVSCNLQNMPKWSNRLLNVTSGSRGSGRSRVLLEGHTRPTWHEEKGETDASFSPMFHSTISFVLLVIWYVKLGVRVAFQQRKN